MKLAVVMPALDEEVGIAAVLEAARRGLREGDELIVADGSSTDRTAEVARLAGATVVVGPRGRGRQMNLGAAAATADVLVFVHADTVLPDGFRGALEAALADGRVSWGRFDLRFDEGGPLLHFIARLIGWRSRLFRSATGDQAVFVRRAVFEALGGYREPVLFEDVELVRRLRRTGAMGVPALPVTTSSRRWRNRGVWATTLRMWLLKSLYLAGVPASRLSGHYADER